MATPAAEHPTHTAHPVATRGGTQALLPKPEVRELPYNANGLLKSEVLLKRTAQGKRMRRLLLVLMGLAVATLFLPWQQNIRGNGRVSALRPQDRPQQIVSTIGGQISKWYVAEGQFVRAGQPIVQLTEIKDEYFDPQVLLRYRGQVDAKSSEVGAKRDKAAALARQIATLRQGLVLKLQQGRFKVESDEADLARAKIDFEVAQRQLAGQQALFDQGLKSLTELENRRLKLQEAQAKLISAETKLAASRVDLAGIRADYEKDIAKAESERAATLADVSASQGSLLKLETETSNLEVRQSLYVLRAPQDGYVVQALKAGIGEQIKAQEAIATIMPENPSLAVELYVTANDVPLLHRGQPVRLQFDGWPALQFSGWPSVSVGTFGGRIQVVDYTSSTSGTYRLLVVPDSADQAWPDAHLLRQGSGVYGWAMLNEVPVWYELWRQLNGFPPSLPGVPVVAPADAAYGGEAKEKSGKK